MVIVLLIINSFTSNCRIVGIKSSVHSLILDIEVIMNELYYMNNTEVLTARSCCVFCSLPPLMESVM